MKNTETIGVATQLVDFGVALKALKEGKRVCRKGWNGKGRFVFRQVPSDVPVKFVEKMTSLPQAVKDEFIKRGVGPSYTNQFAIVHPDSSVDSWVPSVSDSLVEDWIILD